MDQMNVSMTDHQASYVRKKVKSGRYYNASEVVRDVVRRMEEARESQLAQSQEESLPANLAGEQRESIRRLVRKRLESAGPANSVEIHGPRRAPPSCRSCEGSGAQGNRENPQINCEIRL